MKTIWILWWMSWESTQNYYKIINEEIKNQLWWLNSGEIILHSVNFEEIEKLQHKWDWKSLTKIMIDNAKTLESAWADFIIIATNTMHKMADDIIKNINIPLLHIAEATAEEIIEKWLKSILLLWTKFTMEEDFYKNKLIEKWINVVVPDENDRNIIHNIIYNELCLWDIKNSSKEIYKNIINKYNKSTSWVILWCTEIWMLIKQDDIELQIFDTTEIHAKKSAIYSIK